MARLAVARLKSLTVAVSGTISNVLKANEAYEDAEEILIIAPSSIGGGGTITLEVTDNPDAASPAWRTLQDSAAVDVTIPGAGKARAYSAGVVSAGGIRIKCSANITGADAIWAVTKQYRTD